MARVSARNQQKATVEAVTDKLLGRDTIGNMSDKLYDLRESKRELEAKVAEIEAQYKDVEGRLMEKLEAEGTDKGAGKKASVSITTGTVGNIVDWDAFNAFIKKNGYFHLYQRRVSDPALRELWDAGKKVPGAEPFTRKRLNLRGV